VFVLLLLIGLEHRSPSSKPISKSNTNHREVHPLNQSVKVIQTTQKSVCITFTDWFRGRTSVWFVLLLLIGLEDGLLCGLYYFY
jgi:hypothetical protein